MGDLFAGAKLILPLFFVDVVALEFPKAMKDKRAIQQNANRARELIPYQAINLFFCIQVADFLQKLLEGFMLQLAITIRLFAFEGVEKI